MSLKEHTEEFPSTRTLVLVGQQPPSSFSSRAELELFNDPLPQMIIASDDERNTGLSMQSGSNQEKIKRMESWISEINSRLKLSRFSKGNLEKITSFKNLLGTKIRDLALMDCLQALKFFENSDFQIALAGTIASCETQRHPNVENATPRIAVVISSPLDKADNLVYEIDQWLGQEIYSKTLSVYSRPVYLLFYLDTKQRKPYENEHFQMLAPEGHLELTSLTKDIERKAPYSGHGLPIEREKPMPQKFVSKILKSDNNQKADQDDKPFTLSQLSQHLPHKGSDLKPIKLIDFPSSPLLRTNRNK